jgi:DNA (cytosine-5)-methyltransferase 1
VHGCYERDSNNEINTGKRGQYAQRDTKQGNEHGYSANTGSERLQGSIQAGINAKQNRHIRSIKAISQHLSSDGSRIQFQDFPTQSPICGGNDGVPTELDGITVSKWRRESIKGYGNAIVPQVALNIFKAIEQYEQTINKENL